MIDDEFGNYICTKIEYMCTGRQELLLQRHQAGLTHNNLSVSVTVVFHITLGGVTEILLNGVQFL